MQASFANIYHRLSLTPKASGIMDNLKLDEYERSDFLRDLKKASKKLPSEDDASQENDAQENPEKSDRKES